MIDKLVLMERFVMFLQLYLGNIICPANSKIFVVDRLDKLFHAHEEEAAVKIGVETC